MGSYFSFTSFSGDVASNWSLTDCISTYTDLSSHKIVCFRDTLLVGTDLMHSISLDPISAQMAEMREKSFLEDIDEVAEKQNNVFALSPILGGHALMSCQITLLIHMSIF